MALLRSIAIATAAGTAVVLALAAPASAAREREHPRAGPLPAGAPVEHVQDTVFQGSAPRAARALRATASRRLLRTHDGFRVEVEASVAYTPDLAADQALVDFLASRLHGPELGGLRVYVGTPEEIRRICGGDPRVVACYAIGEGRMFVPGESVQGIPVEYPLTHEYGHHVASWRQNAPWDALDWGAKHWASVTRVCRYVQQGLLFPGNQGKHYRDDPGEGFADGYAHYHYPDFPWYYNELMRPGPLQFEAIRRDVLEPWTGPRKRTFAGRVGPQRRKRSFWIRARLDGELELRLHAENEGIYSVEAETKGYATGRVIGRNGSFGVDWCRRRPAELVKLTVRRREGGGPFALTVRWAG